MSRETEDRAAYLGALFARMNPHPAAGEIARDVANIRRNARSLEALAVKDCNYGLTARDRTRRENLEQGVARIADRYQLEAVCSGDPRGLVVKLWKCGERDQAGAAGDAFGGGWGVF